MLSTQDAPQLTASDVAVAILAGGLGTRLRSVVADRPKVMANVGGRPFLAYQLDQLAEAGFSRVVLLTGWRGNDLRAEFGDAYRSLRLIYSREPEPVGTAGALRHALPYFETRSIVALNGDSYHAVDFASLLGFHRDHAQATSIVVTEVTDVSRYGRVEMDGAERVTSFREKSESSGLGWINAGVYVLPVPLVAEIPAGRPVSIEREVFPDWVDRGLVHGFRSRGPFLDIGTPESFALAEDFLKSRKSA